MNNDLRFPIRDVAEQTGVNPVTLRAWQRRFGLLTPERTEKGHRLYSEADIQRVRAILGWLEKGVAISQIKPLLEQSTKPKADNSWSEQVEELSQLSLEMDGPRLRHRLEQAMALYPPGLMHGKILQPWLTQWQQSIEQRADRSWLEAWLQHQLSGFVLNRLSHDNQHNRGPACLICHLEPVNWWQSRLLQLAWSQAGNRVEAITLDSLEALPLVADRLKAQVLRLDLPARLSQAQQEQLQHHLAGLTLPVRLSGEFAPLYTQLGIETEQPGGKHEAGVVS